MFQHETKVTGVQCNVQPPLTFIVWTKKKQTLRLFFKRKSCRFGRTAGWVNDPVSLSCRYHVQSSPSSVGPSRCPRHRDPTRRIMRWLIEGAVRVDIERAPTFPSSPSEHHCAFRRTERHHLPGTQQALITRCNTAFGVVCQQSLWSGV